MARFKGKVVGMKGEASRLGSEKNGLDVHADGWASGVHVRAFVNDEGQDCFDVFLTGGSKGWVDRELVATVVDGKLSYLVHQSV